MRTSATTRWLITGALATLALAGLTGPTARADSLWKPSAAGAGNSMFTDKKAHAVGDLLTIIVTENSNATQSATTTVSKKSSTNVAKGVGPILRLIPKFGLGGDSTSAGQGSTTRTNTLNARITVKVIEVKPNGTLVVEGVRSVKTNSDDQITRLTGLVRVEDVAPDNTVLSTAVADANITYTGKGPISDKQKPGFLSKLLKAIF